MNRRNAIAVILIGTGLFCTSVKATVCPPVPNNCWRYIGNWPNNCWEWKCKESDCEYCVGGTCKVCAGNSDMVCCGEPDERFCCWEVSCYRCKNNKCQNICDPNKCEECVDNECKECGGRQGEACCENYGCYYTSQYKCCPGGNGELCPIYPIETECCGTNPVRCCNPQLCEQCDPISKTCNNKCDLSNCENCVDGNCESIKTCRLDVIQEGTAYCNCMQVIPPEYECVGAGVIDYIYNVVGECSGWCECQTTEQIYVPDYLLPICTGSDCQTSGCDRSWYAQMIYR